MNDSIVFSEEQKAVLLALASRWLDTALQAERLAEEHPKEEEKFPLLRRAAHYRDSAVELQMLVELGDLPCKDTMSFAEKTKRDATARAWVAAPEGHAIACTIFLADRDWHWRIDLPGGDYRHSRPYCTRERAEEALEDELDRIHHEGCYRDWPVRRPSPTDARQQGEG